MTIKKGYQKSSSTSPELSARLNLFRFVPHFHDLLIGFDKDEMKSGPGGPLFEPPC